ncbi:hypothetical protein Skr01_28730 [Sphaerisporangium krabiense]|uniref:Uncharacterized protein n=1 Tax=Sphaerisporangium krabiense TaxID=763782 RepID=A0A7W9DT48_9ACTN|nr:hypothetical protein [Sphaerisporangium krabiense]MBB5630261.1 hypothetical protein [Sphaerisporangium krabiense]GII62788.1 hypothetical protein Skr01_28730 [Sphaerisporangium krabiense]
MATETARLGSVDSGSALNGRHHKAALYVFSFVVLAHWAEHIAQAIQIYALGWPLPEARGVLGLPFPWLVKSEWMHYGYALLMLVGLIMLRKGFTGRSRTWWNISLGIQVWHHFEHLLLLLQAITGNNLAGKPVPTSIIQLLVPRVELHLFYNTVVFIPMVVAMVLHLRPNAAERAEARCSCALPVPARA